MKLKALCNLSGRPGEREKGDTFDVSDAAYAELLVKEGLAERVTAPAKKPAAAAASTDPQA